MRSRSGIWLGATGLLGSCAVVLAIGLLTASGDAPAGTEAQDSTTTTQARWESDREVRIGPALVVPTSLESDDPGSITFTYEVIPLVPLGDEIAGDPLPATPTSFTLITADGTESGATARGPGARAVTFRVPDGVGAGDAVSVRVDRYLVGTPVRLPVDVPLEGAAWHPAGPGVRVRLVRILEQSENDLVIVELESPGDAATRLSVDGIGRDWVSASGSMLGSSNWTLDHRGEALPDPLPLEVRGIVYVPVDADLEMDVGGLAR
jgi:hypothetical protein